MGFLRLTDPLRLIRYININRCRSILINILILVLISIHIHFSINQPLYRRDRRHLVTQITLRVDRVCMDLPVPGQVLRQGDEEWVQHYPHLYLNQSPLRDINNTVIIGTGTGGEREIGKGSGSILETCLRLQTLMAHPTALHCLADQEDN